MIYDDSNVLTPSAIQVDEITVTFEAIFGPPSAEHTYAVWDPTPNQMVSLNSISSFMNGFSGVTGTIIGNIQNSMGNFVQHWVEAMPIVRNRTHCETTRLALILWCSALERKLLCICTRWMLPKTRERHLVAHLRRNGRKTCTLWTKRMEPTL